MITRVITKSTDVKQFELPIRRRRITTIMKKKKKTARECVDNSKRFITW